MSLLAHDRNLMIKKAGNTSWVVVWGHSDYLIEKEIQLKNEVK